MEGNPPFLESSERKNHRRCALRKVGPGDVVLREENIMKGKITDFDWRPALRGLGGCVGLVMLAAFGFASARGAEGRRPNVLFIAVDDLRPALGCYGDASAVSPNIDRLAARGVLFDRAYCQQAVCSPSRLSLLSGRRPDTIRVWDLNTHFRDTLPDLVPLPQLFKDHGYVTRSIGKIYHGSGKPAKDPPSWSLPPLFDHERDPNTRYALPENRAGTGLKRASVESADVADDTYVDGLVCEAALQDLGEMAAGSEPFFLAVGFRKPHLPFCAPRKYWEMHQRDRIPPPATRSYPDGAPELATRSWGEFEGYSDIPEDGQLTAEKVAELRHGYYACVSYVDALVGRLLDRLEELGLAENTIICLWGDHGFHLGEQGLWTKANNFELSTRVPLIVAAPGIAAARCGRLVELVDVYPSLAELAGLPAPEGVEGISFKPLLEDPARSWKKAVFSQYPRALEGSRHKKDGDIMGRAVRTDSHRYVEWRKNKGGGLLAVELYDLREDPDESVNIVMNAEPGTLLPYLRRLLERGWQDALPPP
jgi:iduronate 2-sulfatase